MLVELRALADIKPYDQNPRRNDGAVEAVANLIREYGFRQPIVVDSAGLIVVGHTRWKAAQQLGMTEVPVHVAREQTPEQARAYRIIDPPALGPGFHAPLPEQIALPGGDSVPERIGPFAIKGVLGRGGMGVVYLAEQERPRRPVALKVLAAGAASVDALRRFELEGEVLARLEHAGIARIYESGTDQSSGGPVPYFAMELINGVPLVDYLSNEPILARPASTLCEARKFARRHKALVGAAGAIAFVSLVAAVVAVVLLVKASRAESLAKQQAAIAEREARASTDTVRLLESVFSPVRGDQERGRRITARDVLELAIKELDGSAMTNPELESRIRSILGGLCHDVGLLGVSERQLRLALARHAESEQPDASADEIRGRLAGVLYDMQKYDQAESLYRELLARARTTRQPDDHTLIMAIRDVGVSLMNQAKLVEAEPLLKEVLDARLRTLGPKHGFTLWAMRELGDLYRELGRYPEAVELQERELATSREQATDGPPDGLYESLLHLSWTFQAMGDLQRAEQLLDEAVGRVRSWYGDHHRRTGLAIINIAKVHAAQGNLQGAERELVEAMAIMEAVHGTVHEDIAVICERLADVVERSSGREGEAREPRGRAERVRGTVASERLPSVPISK